jgi:hypothetical protein
MSKAKPRRDNTNGVAPRDRSARSADFGSILGASRTLPVRSQPHGPFGVAALLDEFQRRLVSRGGHPADTAATIRRLVPLRKTVWEQLQRHADLLSVQGRRVSPGQLAAILLERGTAVLGTRPHARAEARNDIIRASQCAHP